MKQSRYGSAWFAAALLVSFAGAATAQQGDYDVRLPAPRTTFVQVQAAAPETAGLDIPQPPDIFYQGPPKTAMLVPPGTDRRPEPISPEVNPVDPASLPETAGVFQYYYNEVARPTGASVSPGLTEPTTTVNRDVALYTGNSYAALSKDSGQSWEHINPFTRFGTVDGGFCCDQRVLHVPGAQSMTFWLLEYRYSATTGRGSLVIAFARGRDDLKNNTFFTFTLSPQTWGFGTGFFLDFSDLSYSNGYLYGSAIVGRSSNNTAADLVLWRAQLSDVYDLGGIGLSYYLTGSLGGYGNYRFAQGAGSTKYWAAHESGTRLRVYKWADAAGGASIHSRAVAQWSGSATPAPGPDGRDWTSFGYTMNTVLGGYDTGSEVGFLWTSGAIGSRPNNFVRVARFDKTSSVGLIGERDIWSSAIGYHFPNAATNALGHVGVVLSWGGGTWYPSFGAFLIDNYTSWNTLATVYTARSGQMGPSSNRWGDYLHAARNSNYTNTFTGAGFTRRNTGASEPRYLWFGRDDHAPDWVQVSVQSQGVGAVAIEVEEADRLSRTDGTTTFTREYPRSQAYTLTAPATKVSGSTTYLFQNWRYNVQPGASFVNAPAGQRTLAQNSIGSLDDICIAVYLARRTLSIRSTNPSSGVPITVSPTDVNGNNNGSTTFTRYYTDRETVTLTAPSTANRYNPFKRWRVNGANQPLGLRAIRVSMTGTVTAYADYYLNVAGSVTRLGRGCVGRNGLVPAHTITWPSGQQGPQQGVYTDYRMSNGAPNMPAALYFGLRRDRWGAFRLPLDLGLIGATGCTFYHDVIVSQNFRIDSRGGIVFRITWPVNAAAIGHHIYSSFVFVDPGVRRPLEITVSDALDLVQGGNR